MKLLACILTVMSAVSTFGRQLPVVRFGRCPKVSSQPDLNLEKVLGTWYEIERFPTHSEQGRCGRIQLSEKEVLLSEIDECDNMVTIKGEVSARNLKDDAVFDVKFGSEKYPYPFRVLEIDYAVYAVVTSCLDLFFLHIEFAWIYSRYDYLPEALVDILERKLKYAGFETSAFKKTSQMDVDCCLHGSDATETKFLI